MDDEERPAGLALPKLDLAALRAPLVYAATQLKTQAVEALLALKADVNGRDRCARARTPTRAHARQF